MPAGQEFPSRTNSAIGADTARPDLSRRPGPPRIRTGGSARKIPSEQNYFSCGTALSDNRAHQTPQPEFLRTGTARTPEIPGEMWLAGPRCGPSTLKAKYCKCPLSKPLRPGPLIFDLQNPSPLPVFSAKWKSRAGTRCFAAEKLARFFARDRTCECATRIIYFFAVSYLKCGQRSGTPPIPAANRFAIDKEKPLACRRKTRSSLRAS